MADGERTEAPTARKLSELRGQGDVARSAEFPLALGLLVGATILKVFGPPVIQRLEDLMRVSLLHPWEVSTNSDALRFETLDLSIQFGLLLAPLFLAAMFVGVSSSLLQVGIFFSPKLAMPQFSRVNPLNGLKRLVSLMGFVELAKSVIKLTVIGGVIFQALSSQQGTVLMLAHQNIMSSTAWLTTLALDLTVRVAVAFMVLSVGDYLFQRWQFSRRAKMTRDEVKEEHRSTEGSPEVKQRLRQTARALAMKRMMQSVPSADVVITNPTHLAIALKYEMGSRAPRVLAKGERLIAERIKELARAAGVPIIENKPLAQALFRAADVGSEIPAAFYQVVAELLAYVYRLKGPRWRFA